MNKKFKGASIAVAVVLAATALASCGQKQTTSGHSDINLDSYPINTDVELTYWVALDTNITASCANMNETPLAQEMEKRTGVKGKIYSSCNGSGE